MKSPMLEICDMLDDKLRPNIAKLVAVRDFSFEILNSAGATPNQRKYATVGLRGIEDLIYELQDNFEAVYEKAGSFLEEERQSSH
jgi:hypothetical protein